MYPQIPLAQQIIQACKAKNIKHIVISPGSRNAPLTIGFSSDEFFKCYSIVDERSAGFFALGIAQQLSEPVAVVCTSGSAVLNYYPAVSEAFYSNIPLVVISADRPSQKIDIGDGQTIRQINVLSNHTAYNANLSENTNFLTFNQYELNNALNTALKTQLPIHINAPFEEPLYKLSETILPFENQEVTMDFLSPNPTFVEQFCKDWNNSSKKIVLVGILKPNSVESQWIELLANDPSVVVLTENLSNLQHSDFFQMIDTFITPIQNDKNLQKEFQPDMLISFGGMIVSKKIKEFLRTFPPKKHYHIDPFSGYDTFFCLTHHFKTKISAFFETIHTKLIKVSSNYHHFWRNFRDEMYLKREAFLNTIPYSDMYAYQSIFQHLTENIHLQISNSAAIRYAQLFPCKEGWEIFCNRGTSGIDGSTSTAIGAAIINPKPTLFITGDLSFFYNSNALWCQYVSKNFKIILINNDGGGIFRILPADKTHPSFEPFFETPHGLTAEHLCKMYQWEYTKATCQTELDNELTSFLKPSKTPKLLEIFTPRKINDTILTEYFSFLKK